MRIPDELAPTIYRYQKLAPVPVGRLASELGIEVFKSTLKPGISGLIEPSDTSDSGYRIKINRHEPVVRQRFTLAHEISHFILHRYDIGGGLFDDTLYRSKLSDKKEVEANKLASIILMPKEIVQKERQRFIHLPEDEQVTALAKLFRVSKEAMRIKLGF